MHALPSPRHPFVNRNLDQAVPALQVIPHMAICTCRVYTPVVRFAPRQPTQHQVSLMQAKGPTPPPSLWHRPVHLHHLDLAGYGSLQVNLVWMISGFSCQSSTLTHICKNQSVIRHYSEAKGTQPTLPEKLTFLKVLSPAKILPPIHVEYFLSGGAKIFIRMSFTASF